MEPEIIAACVTAVGALLATVVAVIATGRFTVRSSGQAAERNAAATLASAEKMSAATIAASRHATDAALEQTRLMISAAREVRIWEKRAELYVDLIAQVMTQSSRQLRMQARFVSADDVQLEPATPEQEASRLMIHARLDAFGSQAILDAYEAAIAAYWEAQRTWFLWKALFDQGTAETREGRLAQIAERNRQREEVDDALVLVNSLNQKLIEAIRRELSDHGGGAGPARAGWLSAAITGDGAPSSGEVD
ncbi:hypothetical protein [Catellatospora methionotrophica]|uniref:hypothetical protein n=1 Tax=Catellatospora methionotrophica TaxID=121620 RepID=UPI0033FB7CE5